jgi:hypothetical protein
MTFRLTTLLYLFALLAASMALFAVKEPTFAPLGLLLGIWIFWGWKCYKRDPGHYQPWPRMLQLIGTFVLLPIIFYYLLQPGVARGRPRGPHNLKQLALALHNYHLEHGHYPPPYVADEQGKPLYSWRVLILPYIDQIELSKQFKDDEPWDSPDNRKLLADLWVFMSNERTITGDTHFVAVAGEGTIWDPKQGVAAADITDSLNTTLLLVEIPSQGIAWSEPRDLSLDEALAILQDDTWEERSDNGYFVSTHHRIRKSPARLVATADGAVHTLPPGINRADAMAFLTRAGGEPVQPLEDPQRRHEQTVIHWHRITNAILWIAIILLPFNRRVPIFPTKPK